jgi:neutral ceramidase
MRHSLTITLFAVVLGTPAWSAGVPQLRAGAAKVDVTPAERELPPGYDGILDHIYSRAVVISDGTALAALISVDAGAVPDPIWTEVTRRLESELGIPTDNVLLTATHTHSVPRQDVGAYTDRSLSRCGLQRPDS